MPRKSTTTEPVKTRKSSAKKTTTKSTTATKKAAPTKAATTTKKTTASKTSVTKTTATKKPTKPSTAKKTASKPVSETAAVKKTAVKKGAEPKVESTARKKAEPSKVARKVSPVASKEKVTAESTKATTTRAAALLDPQHINLPGKPIVFGDITIEPYDLGKADEYMGLNQKDHFIKILHAWKRALMQEVDRTVSLLQDEVKNLPDMTDRASQEEEFSVALRTRDRERKLIRKIDQTLTRIREDDYGFCDMCGIEIGIRRLEARPTANLCIDCKTLDEIVEKQTRG